MKTASSLLKQLPGLAIGCVLGFAIAHFSNVLKPQDQPGSKAAVTNGDSTPAKQAVKQHSDSTPGQKTDQSTQSGNRAEVLGVAKTTKESETVARTPEFDKTQKEASLLKSVAEKVASDARLFNSASAGGGAHDFEAERVASDTKFLTGVGLNDQQIKDFCSERSRLYQLAVPAGQAMSKLIEARVMFDKHMREVLGEEKYQAYRRYEETKPAVREVKEMNEFAEKNGRQPLDEKAAAPLISLIYSAGATTTESWDGPYDPYPRPEHGFDMLRIRVSERLTTLSKNYDTLSPALDSINLSRDHVDLVKAYYGERIKEKWSTVEKMSLGEEEYRRLMHQEMDQRVNALRLKIKR